MTLPELTWGFRLLLVVLTCYRLARMIALDDGPFFIFKRLRYLIKDKAYLEADKNAKLMFSINTPDGEIDDRHFGKWHNLAEGITCPYCVGVWLSIPLFFFVVYPISISDLRPFHFLILMSISGGR